MTEPTTNHNKDDEYHSIKNFSETENESDFE